MFEANNQIFEGMREDILNKLKELAKPSCNKCYGRGFIHWRENKKTGQRIYEPCKCVNKNSM